MNFFTSDTHYLHGKILFYCGRPFATIDEMTDVFIENWNKTVSPGDTVYHLGDFAFVKTDKKINNEAKVTKIFEALHGTKILIAGGHDKSFVRKSLRWQSVHEALHTEIDGTIISMSHFPFLTWNRSHYGSICVHGHHHSKVGLIDPRVRRFDVGVDAWGYCPVSLDKIKEIAATITVKPLDRHEKT